MLYAGTAKVNVRDRRHQAIKKLTHTQCQHAPEIFTTANVIRAAERHRAELQSFWNVRSEREPTLSATAAIKGNEIKRITWGF